MQLTTSQNSGSLTDVNCECRQTSEQRDPLLSAHHSWKCCLRLRVLHFQNICAASGREKIASVTKAVLKTSLKCCVLHPWSSHCFSVGHHSPEAVALLPPFTLCRTALTITPFSRVILVCAESQWTCLLKGTLEHCLNTPRTTVLESREHTKSRIQVVSHSLFPWKGGFKIVYATLYKAEQRFTFRVPPKRWNGAPCVSWAASTVVPALFLPWGVTP